MEDKNKQEEGIEFGNINLCDIPNDIAIELDDQLADKMGERDVPFVLPDFGCRNAAAARNWPAAGSAAVGSVSSHGSVTVFGRTTCCTLDQIIQDEVIVIKGD